MATIQTTTATMTYAGRLFVGRSKALGMSLCKSPPSALEVMSHKTAATKTFRLYATVGGVSEYHDTAKGSDLRLQVIWE